jgi:hypothetical protein
MQICLGMVIGGGPGSLLPAFDAHSKHTARENEAILNE